MVYEPTRFSPYFHGRRRQTWRNLLAVIGLLVVVVGGVGWYMGWYKLSFTRGTDGNLEIKTDVDTNKVSSDTSNAFKNISAAVNNVEKKAQDAQTTPATSPAATPATPDGSPAKPGAQDTPNKPSTPIQGTPPSRIKPAGGAVKLIPPK